MAKGAPKGNQFWRLRAKHGRDKIFATPKIMLDAACEYFNWCDDNPLIEVDYMNTKQGIEEIHKPKMRPYTLHGLTSYLHVNTLYFNDFENALKEKDDEISKDFSVVITHIRETIYNQKFTGAASGFFNSNIIARDLGLSDKQEHDVKTDKPIQFLNASDKFKFDKEGNSIEK